MSDITLLYNVFTTFRFSQFDTILNTRFSGWGLLDEVGFWATPKLSFGDGGRECRWSGRLLQMSAKFICCFRHGQVTTFLWRFSVIVYTDNSGRCGLWTVCEKIF